ncbi:MAG: ABC transporter ATP-binding protein [Desulfurococcales archaeon]|nr:ABC transporter ATP-binding protein [Desulfurococcales archaeon]MCE4605094.1 ABC transporter ATP-binding protein [Desulfurococcales archaeon]
MALLEVEDLKKYFIQGDLVDRLLRRVRTVKAVDGVTFKLGKGETLALVGESGSGKTTTGKLVLRLLEPTGGRIVFDGVDITRMKEGELRKLRPRMQMIYQDPYASLNPRMEVGRAIAEPLVVHGRASWSEARREALEMLERVGLTPAKDFYRRRPIQLSGGQRQRVVIARAMILKPNLLVADEPVSMIDVSMRTSILKLLLDFKKEYNMSMIMITHDLAVARLVAERVAVMYLGKIVEMGPTEDILHNPSHPYTEALIAAAPTIVPRARKPRLRIKGEIADPSRIPSGCRFHPRCPYSDSSKCIEKEPQLRGDSRIVACHYPLTR